MSRLMSSTWLSLILVCSSAFAQPAAIDLEKQELALKLLRRFDAINMLKVQSAMSVLKFREHKMLICLAGRGRMMEFLEPAVEAEVEPRAEEYERLLAREIASRTEKFELSSVLERGWGSPFRSSYFQAYSDSIRAIAPETIRLGAELGRAAVIVALARAGEAGLKAEPGGECEEANASAAAASKELAEKDTAGKVRSELAKLSEEIGNMTAAPLKAEAPAFRAKIESILPRLKQIGENAAMPDLLRSDAWYGRGVAAASINLLRSVSGLQADDSVAIQGISDLESALAIGKRSPDWNARKAAQANYMAGLIARDHLLDRPLAGKYALACADLGHAGCMNMMALAYLVGDLGLPVDMDSSISYHKRVVETGTRFTCAGYYSAIAIATHVGLDGAVTEEGDALFWLDKAKSLRDEIVEKRGDKRFCLGSYGVTTFHFFRKARNFKVDEELAEQLRLLIPTEPAAYRVAFMKLVLGEGSESEFELSLPKDMKPEDRCGVMFPVVWHYKLAGDAASMKRFRQKLLNVADESNYCSLIKRRVEQW